LALAGSNALTISLSSGSKAVVGGQTTLQDAAHRLTAGDVNGITFQSGSIFTTSSGFSGNPFGAGTDGSVVFQSGSSAFFNAGGDLNMLLGNLTISGTLNTNGRAVKFQGGGIFGGDTQIISCTMDCTIATFNDLVILKAAGSVKLGGAVTINGALQFDGTGSA